MEISNVLWAYLLRKYLMLCLHTCSLMFAHDVLCMFSIWIVLVQSEAFVKDYNYCCCSCCSGGSSKLVIAVVALCVGLLSGLYNSNPFTTVVLVVVVVVVVVVVALLVGSISGSHNSNPRQP